MRDAAALTLVLLAMSGCIRVFAPPVSTADGGTVTPAPTAPVFRAFSPARAFAGDTLHLEVADLDARAGAITVVFPNGDSVAARETGGTGLEVMVPEGAASGSLVLVNAVGRSNALDGFVYRGFGHPRLVAAPVFRTVVPRVRGLWTREDDALAWWADLGILHSWRHGPLPAPVDVTAFSDANALRLRTLDLIGTYAAHHTAGAVSVFAGNPPDFSNATARCALRVQTLHLSLEIGAPTQWACDQDALVATNLLTCTETLRLDIPGCGSVLGAFNGGACVTTFNATAAGDALRCVDAAWGLSAPLPGVVRLGTATRLADGTVAGAGTVSDTSLDAPYARVSAFSWDGTTLQWHFQDVELPSVEPVDELRVEGEDRATAGVFLLQSETDQLTRLELTGGRTSWGVPMAAPSLAARMPAQGSSGVTGALVVASRRTNELHLRHADTSVPLGVIPLEVGLGGAGGTYVGTGDGTGSSGFRVCSSGTGVIVKLDENGAAVGYEPSGAWPGDMVGCAFPPGGPVLVTRHANADDKVHLGDRVVGELPLRSSTNVNQARLVVDDAGNTWIASGTTLAVVRRDGSFAPVTSAVAGALGIQSAAATPGSGLLVCWSMQPVDGLAVSMVERLDLAPGTGEPRSLHQRPVEGRVHLAAAMRDGVRVLTTRGDALSPQAEEALWTLDFQDARSPSATELPFHGTIPVPGQMAVSPDGRFLAVVPPQVFDLLIMRINAAGRLENAGLFPLERGVLGLAFSDSGETLMAVVAANQTVRRERDQVALFR